jgi:diguanylate cyclase (GGDEF)-like protein/PAS domain S-box-containing protein
LREGGGVPEYDFSEKGEEFLASFTDPGPAFDPAQGPPDIWFRRVMEHSSDFVIAFQHDGTIVYVTESIELLLGWSPAALIGTSALDLIHPDDLENAAETVYHAAEVEGWRPPRPFRLLHADGSAATFEVEGMSLFHVPEVRSIVCAARYAESTARIDAIVGLLAAHAPLSDILDQLVHVMARPGWHFGVAIQYEDAAGRLAVAHTGLPPELATFDRAHPSAPWAEACSTGQPVYDLGLRTVGDELAGAAEAAGFRTCWAIPVADDGRADACIVVWNHELHPPELGQEILLTKLRQLLELALAGRARADRLVQDARTDALSGLGNRRSFDAAIASHQGQDVAVLFVDLDGFKAVNDRLGHAAGDEVLRQVGARIRASIRETDVAARIGGDEFAILCPAIDEGAVLGLARRLIDAVATPIVLDASADERADIGVSIGIAMATPGSDPDLVHLVSVADEQLYQAKQRGKGRFELAYG